MLPTSLCVLIAASLGALATAPAPHAGSHHTHAPPPDIRVRVARATVPLADAIAAAEALARGEAVRAELENEDDQDAAAPVYSIFVLTAQDAFVEVEVDARTGKATLDEDDDDKNDEREDPDGPGDPEDDPLEGEPGSARTAALAATYRAALDASNRSLAQLVAEAATVVRGSPVAATLEGGRRPIAEVVVVAGRYLVEVDLDAKTGLVKEFELSQTLGEGGQIGWDGDGANDDDDDHDDHGEDGDDDGEDDDDR